MKVRVFVVAGLMLCLISGCRANSGFIPAGQYSGSTQAQQSVNIVVGDKVTLDGVEMRSAPQLNGWFVGVHDKKTRMRCRTAVHGTEIVCTIERHGVTETDELLKL